MRLVERIRQRLDYGLVVEDIEAKRGQALFVEEGQDTHFMRLILKKFRKWV